MTDLDAGVIVASGFFAAEDALSAGEGVVGLELSPGEYPTMRLAPGDVVDVVAVDEPGGVLVSAAVVFEATDLNAQGSRFVALRMRADDAAAVARAAAADGVRLVLVGGG